MNIRKDHPVDNDPIQRILLSLQEITGADVVLLGDVQSFPVQRIQILYCRIDQAWQPSFSYLLDTHPCGRVMATQQFQQYSDIADQFPEAYFLQDESLIAYAGLPISLDRHSTNGIIVAMSRHPWKNPESLQEKFVELVANFNADHDSVLNAIERVKSHRSANIREEIFCEYVQNNPTGMSYSELMPPVPINLPDEQLIQRLMYTGFVVECNNAMAHMYGYPDMASMMGARPVDVNGPERAHRNISYWVRQNYNIPDSESQAVDAEGNVTWISGSVTGKIVNGKVVHFLAKRRDLTVQKRYEAAIQHKAHHDELTELPNRYWFKERLAELIKDHTMRDKQLCVGLLDLNGFKEINDTLGHTVGDLILRAVAVRLLKGLKFHGAEIARLGGDEFAIIMPEITEHGSAEAMADTLHQLLSEPFSIEDMQLSIGGSLGLAHFPDGQATGEDLLRLADVAMYEAKDEGMPFRWYHPDIDKHSKRRLSLLTSLSSAIENGELFLVYQPKIDMCNGRVSGFEALTRWQHPVHGLIPPNDFIPFAETNTVIRPLTQWVLDTAIRQGALWLAEGRRLKMAVNVSVRNLRDENLASYTAACLKKHGFPAELLELEVTESGLMTSPAQAMNMLQALRALGVSIAIDDFGTGYSSLAYLARLPVTTLKIDQVFVKDMVRSKSEEQIVRSIIGLAHQFQLKVVAEGVEDEATLSALLHMECDVAQGFFIARPMDAEKASQWIVAEAAKPEGLSLLQTRIKKT